ncbi:4-alpha-glucanotransferase [Xanthobacter sp. SG618]|uniref:4-alpha-glucanotransferase n=1 Tax=Xanthobacter sp. SG618 TaxID=2587121 RepID=UPI00145E76FC|nr:4-alpha-glucanotransferase [Xanthobacter sp. SG618]NMN59623.1 4-alpha-glucanotransferase [Xanthobacter sp. SG618]
MTACRQPDPLPIEALARAAGVSIEWADAFARPHRVPVDTLERVLCALGHPCGTPADIRRSLAALQAPQDLPGLMTADAGREVVLPGIVPSVPAELEGETPRRVTLRPHREGSVFTAPETPGYHVLSIGAQSLRLAVAPRRAPSVAERTSRARAFGVAAQVYGLRQAGDGGIGHLGAVAALAERLAGFGAHAVALSPLHALFSAAPERFSPYSPSSRLALNPLLADIAAFLPPGVIDGEDEGPDAFIDWPRAARRKLAYLRRLFDTLDTFPEAAGDFRAFAALPGDDLARHALFEALHAAMIAGGHGPDWRKWPAPLRDPESPEVADFASAQANEVRFHLFLQWLAARSLAAAQARARAAGMGIGLISDLAVGLDPAGSQAWSRPGDLLAGLAIGAPPDLINVAGQNWGLTAISPTALAAQNFEPFLAAIRAALRHAGGVRIDHILGLRRLWLVPDGAGAGEGAYLTYPLQDLLRLVAIEAHAHGAIAIGEDLGTVPEGLRAEMTALGILGMRVLPFERDEDGGFLPPEDWQREAVGMTSTHDLPTIAGWWHGRDLHWRARITASDVAAEALTARAGERTAFTTAAAAAGIATLLDDAECAVDAAVAYVAQSACDLAIIPLEDLLGLDESPNLPGTVDEHPNWRRRLSAPAEDLLAAPRIRARLSLLQQTRGEGAAQR